MAGGIAVAQNLLRRFGYRVIRVGGDPKMGDYEPVRPVATYSPWNRDALFNETFRTVESHTLVDKYRCWELWTLVEQSRKLSGALIEVGVWRGGTGALIARKAALCSIPETVYLCDTFSGVVKAGADDPLYRGGEHGDTSRRIVEDLVQRRMKLDNVKILEGVFPDETSHLVADSRFRFCHIDVDVYESAKGVVSWIWDRMAPGGIVVYDDYGFQGCEGITKFVEEQRSLPDRLLLHNLNGHAVVVKTGGGPAP